MSSVDNGESFLAYSEPESRLQVITYFRDARLIGTSVYLRGPLWGLLSHTRTLYWWRVGEETTETEEFRRVFGCASR